jgi:uncharacterized protein YehS (DUF1456 family)
MECQDQILRNFLNGLIIHKRGPREDKRDPAIKKANEAKNESKD